ncbi:uncharacterized protein LOC129595986 isoform X2 [Paramacrobiotus metropolitanus]|uniref:uncharacterized protein LOC129595986 isoform X2 n=1 Tax=Paramacrobiotus metropolitanus TaxID=2943436 RepID=UPI002445B0C6|nr:uncharacterized protein LOC129595986 isoform X2 [Paramacrobiotus metropolitanus]
MSSHRKRYLENNADPATQNQVAVKLVAQWRKALTFHHVNLVRYFHAKEHDNEFIPTQKEGILILEFCEMGNLEAYLANKRQQNVTPPLPLVAVKSCVHDILQGLSYLHADENKVAHTDLKPANILLTVRDGVIVTKIADIDDHVAIIATMTRSEVKDTRGTERYQSPEILQAKYDLLRVGRKTDIWSVGVIVVELGRGSLPFKLIKMDGVRPVRTDYMIVEQRSLPMQVRDFIVQNGVPDIPQTEILKGFTKLEQCFKRSGMDRPKAVELLQDPWFKGGPWQWRA